MKTAPFLGIRNNAFGKPLLEIFSRPKGKGLWRLEVPGSCPDVQR
jgi:hypothetical protein